MQVIHSDNDITASNDDDTGNEIKIWHSGTINENTIIWEEIVSKSYVITSLAYLISNKQDCAFSLLPMVFNFNLSMDKQSHPL